MHMLTLALAVLTVWTASPVDLPMATHEAPPPAWAVADPADSLYRAARRALNSKDYETAADLFGAIVSRYPKSAYAPDALYWKGFAHYRGGNFYAAMEALYEQARRYPGAPTTKGDSYALLIRIQGELAKRGDADAREDIDSAASKSAEDCGDMEIRSAALDALQQMDSERVLPLLKKVLARRDVCSKSLRKNALFILAQKSGAQREDLLLDVARSDPDRDVRAEAVFHLSQARSEEAVGALEQLLKTSPDRAVRNNALFALAQNRSARSKAILRALALSSDAPMGLRNDAIFHLAQDREPESREWIRGAYARIADAALRKNVMFQIASHGGDDTEKWLSGILVDSKEAMELRKNALFHLATTQSSSSVALASVYERVSEELKTDVLFHLANRSDAAALDKLIAVARGDGDADMRKVALFHIANSKDPRALKTLEEMVTP